MATTSKFDFGLINDQIKAHTDQIGNLATLRTTEKTSIVNAVNEIVPMGQFMIPLQCYDINSYKRFFYYLHNANKYNVTLNNVIETGIGTVMPTNFSIQRQSEFIQFYIVSNDFVVGKLYDFTITLSK